MRDGGTRTTAAAVLPGRLKTRAEFLRVQKGERRKGPLFLLEVSRRDDAGPPRVGYTVTKRQGNSVERNRMRRRLREAVRVSGGFAMQPGHDYVIVARRDLLDAAFSRLTSALRARIEGRHERVRPERHPRDEKAAGAVGADEPKSDRRNRRSDTICPSGTNDGH